MLHNAGLISQFVFSNQERRYIMELIEGDIKRFCNDAIWVVF
jgi:hypothetical protein